MADTDQKRIRSIFLSAVEDHAPEQWDEYLGGACRGEPELRRRVEVLLRGHKQPNELLDDPGAAPVGPSRPSIGEGPGTIIGPYKLMEQIGEGGFGVVFMAEQQQPVRRKVALKIVKPGMDTRQVVARFEAERQALALMDHPNIAQIFDGGATDSGRPYFVMELVRGIPITDFCAQHHLGVRERLELFTHVCQAVQHAHQKGIIHRDLKPSNVMVTQHDVTPVVKIIDFGIAKATGQQLTDKTLFTNFAQMIGTPMYMSPEQAQMSGLDVDTRSDVYSLGVLLYELMTGTTPFEKERLRSTPYDEMIRIIREEEPVRPSTRISTLGNAANTAPIDRNITPQKLSQLLRGELDWIVMKALEKDRNRRYESAGAFAADVQRFLDGEVVQACLPTVGYRLHKLARQHKAALATAAMVFAALSIGTGVAVWQAVVATQAKGDALESAAAESKAKTAAQDKEAEAQAVISFLEKRVLAAAQPDTHFGGMGHDVSLRQALEAAVPFVQNEFKDQPLVEARLRMTLGHSLNALGEEQKSADQFAAARAIYSAQLGQDHELTLKSASHLARSLEGVGRHENACELLVGTLQRMNVTFGSDHEETLKAMNFLAACYTSLGRFPEALALRERVLMVRQERLGPEDYYTLVSQLDRAGCLSRLGRRREALAIFENLLPLFQAKNGRDGFSTLNCMSNLAYEYQAVGRDLDARKLREDVLAARKAKGGVDHPLTFLAMHQLAISYRLTGRKDDALRLSEEALARTEKKLGPDHIDTMDCLNGVAACYLAVGRFDDAIAWGEESLKRRKARFGVNHPGTLAGLSNLGHFYTAAGRHEEALVPHQEALTLRTAKLGPAHVDTLGSADAVVRCLFRLGRGTQAVPLLDGVIPHALTADVSLNFVAELMALRKKHFFDLRDVAGCRATAAMWDTLGRTDPVSHYITGRSHALVAWMIQDQDLSAEGVKQSDIEADLAMDWLRKAVAAGYRDSAYMAKDADIDILRKRPDFIKLMAEMPDGPNKDAK